MNSLSNVIDRDHMQRILQDYTRLGDRCYLENAGATLYPQTLLKHVNEDLINNVYMNPHTDRYTRDCVEQIRGLVLKHFNTDPSEYSVVFTSGTTQALKIVVDAFQFAYEDNEILNCGSFVYLRDNHTSVLGLREIAEDKNADVIHISHKDFIQTISNSTPTTNFSQRNYKHEGNTLLVYPAQSNFNGYKYPIDHINRIKEGCFNGYIKKHLCKINCNWYVMLDAASYVATNKLDLSKTQPDFVCLSFYKIFGYPTGLGALLVKNSSAKVLTQKRYFGGGTVDIVLSSEDYHVKRENIYEKFEDGTLPFLSILTLKHCFDYLAYLVPRVVNNDMMETISHHTYHLAKDLFTQLRNLRHPNGNEAAVLYVDSDFGDVSRQGGIVTFNLLRDDGSFIGYAEFQHMADLFNVSVRTGCFCNSGSCQRHLQITNKEMKDMYRAGHKCGDELDLIEGRPTGAIRASFAYFNTFEDVDKLLTMICRCYLKSPHKKPIRQVNGKVSAAERYKAYNDGLQFVSSDSGYYKHVDLSNDATQYDSKITLKEIAIYPIKSCGAFKVKSSWPIGNKGLFLDREWMVVKDNGVCLTQKQNTRMCMLRPKVDLTRGRLMIYFKGMKPMSIPLQPPIINTYKGSLCQSKVCTDIITGFDCGDEVADWTSEALEISGLRLIRQSFDDLRLTKSKKGEQTKPLSLSNQAQFLLINKATVRWLNDKIDDPEFSESVEDLCDRFRGNLVVDMDLELVEREWQRVIIGNHEFKVQSQCSRCAMVCIDQKTGEKTTEPLRTISQQFGGKLRFGIYLSYVGPIANSKEAILKTNSTVTPFVNEDDISR